MKDVTQILSDIQDGKARVEDFVPMVYSELRRLAAQRLANEQPGHTLQITALVHEAYLKLFGSEQNVPWKNRKHFFGAAAEAMRRILVDYARKRRSNKRGGDRKRVPLDDDKLKVDQRIDELLDVNDCLSKLNELDSLKAELVKLRYFAGLTMAEVSKVLEISLPTANRHWAFARAWLYQQIADLNPGR